MLADPNYPPVAKTELRLQLDASKGKIAGLMKMEDTASIGELLGNMMSSMKKEEKKEIHKEEKTTQEEKKTTQNITNAESKEAEKKNAKIETAKKRITAMFDAFG